MQMLGGNGGSPRRLRLVSGSPAALLRTPESLSPPMDRDDSTPDAQVDWIDQRDTLSDLSMRAARCAWLET